MNNDYNGDNNSRETALVTGATSGIGEATARMFAQQGYNVIITGRRHERLRNLKNELKSEYKAEVLTLAFDVSDRRSVESAIGSVHDKMRKIDVLVNNAGLAAGLEHINDGDTLDWERMIDTNIKGLMYVTRVVSNIMIEHGMGHIINIGSIAGTQVYENGAVYCGTKHAVHALSQGMRIDFLKHAIKVTEIRPGMVDTEFSEVRFHGDLERADDVYTGLVPLTGEDVAETIRWAIAQPLHVNIDEIVVTPMGQANAFYTHRKKQ